MTDSILGAVSRSLTPEVIGKIASATGLDPGTAQSAVDASVPAILGGLADLASKPGGARQLSSAIAEQPAGLLSNLASSIGSNAHLQEKGGSMLASLLGGGPLSSIVSAVSKSAGIGENSARSLMAMLTPVVLGVLGREQRASGMEASGLARMLMEQKDHIAAAVPAGLSHLLGARSGTQPGSAQPSTHAYGTQQASYTSARPGNTGLAHIASAPQENTTAPSWPYWVLPLAAVGGLLWYLLPNAHMPEAPTKTSSAISAPAPVQLVPKDGSGLRYLAKAPGDWRSVGTFYNRDVFNRAGEKIGSVKDLLVGPDGTINAAVLGVGGFLGLGERDIAVPLSALKSERTGNTAHLTMDVAKDALRSAPAFEPITPAVK